MCAYIKLRLKTEEYNPALQMGKKKSVTLEGMMLLHAHILYLLASVVATYILYLYSVAIYQKHLKYRCTVTDCRPSAVVQFLGTPCGTSVDGKGPPQDHQIRFG